MNRYDESTKAAVMGALLAGQSISSVAREYQIPKGTVSEWKA
jgi:transposase-like protein